MDPQGPPPPKIYEPGLLTRFKKKRVIAFSSLLGAVLILPLVVFVSLQRTQTRNFASTGDNLPTPASSNQTTTATNSGKNPFYANASDVYVGASNFYIEIGGKKYFGSKPMDLHSDAATPYPSTTTFESIWSESGVEMRMFIYFRVSADKNRWEVYDFRTYNGNNPADWLYYRGATASAISASLGSSVKYQSLDLTSDDGRGLVHFEDLELHPFMNYGVTPTPTWDAESPSVSITNPIGGSQVAKNTKVKLSADATDNVGVANVQFNIAGGFKCTDSSAPYVCIWAVPGLKGKVYNISATAIDASGNSATSAISVTAK